MIAFTIAGLVLVIISATLWTGHPRQYALNKAGQDQTHPWRLAILIIWTLALPVYSLWEWYTQAPPSAANFQSFQYGHKILGDVWTAVAIVLGLLFGIKK